MPFRLQTIQPFMETEPVTVTETKLLCVIPSPQTLRDLELRGTSKVIEDHVATVLTDVSAICEQLEKAAQTYAPRAVYATPAHQNLKYIVRHEAIGEPFIVTACTVGDMDPVTKFNTLLRRIEDVRHCFRRRGYDVTFSQNEYEFRLRYHTYTVDPVSHKTLAHAMLDTIIPSP